VLVNAHVDTCLGVAATAIPRWTTHDSSAPLDQSVVSMAPIEEAASAPREASPNIDQPSPVLRSGRAGGAAGGDGEGRAGADEEVGGVRGQGGSGDNPKP